MNIKLRKRHRWMTGLLAVAAPVLVIAAIVARQTEPKAAELEVDILSPVGAPVVQDWMKFHSDWPAQVGWGEGQLVIEPASTLLGPNLLVYWAAGEPDLPAGLLEGDSRATLPKNAVYLGAYKQTELTRITLPAGFAAGSGRLLLFNLVEKQVVAVSETMKGGESS